MTETLGAFENRGGFFLLFLAFLHSESLNSDNPPKIVFSDVLDARVRCKSLVASVRFIVLVMAKRASN